MNDRKLPESILRDRLALDRTDLANERTWLAYVRTALALFVGGVGAIKFLDSSFWGAIGWTVVACGSMMFVFGTIRFCQVKNAILRQRASLERE